MSVRRSRSGSRVSSTTPPRFTSYLERLPFYDQLMPNREQILQQAGEAATVVSRLLVEWVSSVTLGTANFVFMAFVLLYSMYFLQMDGPQLIEKSSITCRSRPPTSV